jgi:hypothetical protein
MEKDSCKLFILKKVFFAGKKKDLKDLTESQLFGVLTHLINSRSEIEVKVM